MENQRAAEIGNRDNEVSPTKTTGRENSLVPVSPPASARAGGWPKRFAGLLAIAASLIAAGVLWFALGSGLGPPSVSIQTLVAGPVTRVVAVTGRTAAETKVNITAAVSARVEAVPVAEGDQVAADDLLLTLDDSRQQLVVRQALSSLDAAILTRQAAQADADRATALGASIPATEREDADRALQRAENEVEQLTAALEQAQISLSDFRITAPFAGTILTRSVEAGDMAAPEKVLMRLADLDPIHVEVEVDETYAAVLHTGQSVDLQLTGHEDILAGQVAFIADEVDPVTGGVRLNVAFDTPPEAPTGLTTVANIRVARVADALTVPRTALLEDAKNGPAVFVLRNGRAVRTPIEIIDWPEDRVQVTEGLAEGATIILAPEGISDGDRVTPQGEGTGR
jgi:RND family efflux transporter MFP subunit